MGDLRGDGRRFVVAAGLDHFLYEWDVYGRLQPGFPINLWDTSVSTPALADLDNNGQLWIIAGGDSVPGRPGTANWYAIPPWGCAHPDDAVKGCDHAGWPRNQNEVPWSSPATGDIYGNGNTYSVLGTGHYYSQVNGPFNRGAYVNVAAPNGGTQDRLTIPGDVFSSPALGNLGGSGPSVAVISEGSAGQSSQINVWDPATHATTARWSHPGATETGSPSIAPVDGSGQNGVWVPGGGVVTGYDRDGGQVTQAVLPNGATAFAAPAVADLNGAGLSMVETASQGVDDTHAVYSVSAFAIPGSTTAMPVGAWATFHGNNQRSGHLAPVVGAVAVTGGGAHTDATLSWNLGANSPPARGYDVWVWEPSLGWDLYTHTAATSVIFTGLPGHTYQVFVDAQSQYGSADLRKRSQATVSISAGATHSTPLPFRGLYSLSAFGKTGPVDSPALPPGAALWPGWSIARALDVDSQNPTSGQMLDGFGGLHAIGSAPPVAADDGRYWLGWDIARDVAVQRGSNGASGWILDGWGGMHPFGTAPAVSITGYWPGWDIAHRAALIPGTNSGYVLDGWGGLHAFGGAAYLSSNAYWPGWDIARDVAICPAGGGGYVLDGYGGLHPFGTQAGRVTHLDYWPGWDIARAVVVTGADCRSGYTLDGYGGIHPFDGVGGGGSSTAPPVGAPYYLFGQDVFRSLTAG